MFWQLAIFLFGIAASAQAADPIPRMEFVPVPGGVGTFGGTDKEREHFEDESPVFTYEMEGFELQKTLVTQSQWAQVMGDNPSFFSSRLYCPHTQSTVPNVPMCADFPVENVSWHDARRFIERLNDLDPRYEYNLPTEAQMEYAIRAGSTTQWMSGDDPHSLDRYAWSYATAGGQTHEVCRRQPNAFGLCDMVGQVWQLTGDVFARHFEVARAASVEVSPQYFIVVKGGSYGNTVDFLGSAVRMSSGAYDRRPYQGFRLVRYSKRRGA